MANRYFIFLYPERGTLKALLDLAIYALNPYEKWPSHVTVAGPFDSKKRFRIVRKFEATVFGLGIDSFFSYGSPTVFFRVGFSEREAVWRKPDFSGNPIPHLTLYDGKDMEFAREVYKMASSINPFFSFYVKGLHVVNSIPGQYRADLREVVDPNVLQEFQGFKADEIRALDPETRLLLAEKALKAAFTPVHDGPLRGGPRS